MKKQILMGENFKIDLPTLIETRLLVAANSGGGKSWALRRLLEQTHGEVQQIVIDLEGEFYTLREKFDDYLLIGKDGDMPAQVRAAALLATKLLELGVSAIIDLSELKFHERKHFVRLFLESLIEAPEETRHPVMVVIDEAHHFAPQIGDSEATAAVIDICTRGRKREICAVLATQRISKLHKDAIAECNNKMFGRTGQDIDVKRTSDELGFAKSAREAFDTLRNLKAGEFFAFGTAIGSNVERYTVGAVETTHFRRGGNKGRKATPPKSAIKSMLEKLKDLPQEAEAKAKTVAELKQDNATLKQKLTILEKQGGGKPSKEQIEDALRPHLIALASEREAWNKHIAAWKEYANTLLAALSKISGEVALAWKDFKNHAPSDRPGATYTGKMPVKQAPTVPVLRQEHGSSVGATMATIAEMQNGDINLKKGARRMLETLVQRYPMKFTRSQWATVSDISRNSGTFTSYLSALRLGGFIVEERGLVSASQAGIDFLGGSVPEPKTPEEVRAMWRTRLKEGARRMFDVLAEQYPNAITREQLAEAAGISVQSGTFTSYLSALRTNGLVEEFQGEAGREIKMSADLFL